MGDGTSQFGVYKVVHMDRFGACFGMPFPAVIIPSKGFFSEIGSQPIDPSSLDREAIYR
jgi:hypothetical protein